MFSLHLQFVGFNDEVLDVKFLGKGDTHIVVATNSSQLKVFDLATSSCKILYGHTGESSDQQRAAPLCLSVWGGHQVGRWNGNLIHIFKRLETENKRSQCLVLFF